MNHQMPWQNMSANANYQQPTQPQQQEAFAYQQQPQQQQHTMNYQYQVGPSQKPPGPIPPQHQPKWNQQQPQPQQQVPPPPQQYYMNNGQYPPQLQMPTQHKWNQPEQQQSQLGGQSQPVLQPQPHQSQQQPGQFYPQQPSHYQPSQLPMRNRGSHSHLASPYPQNSQQVAYQKQMYNQQQQEQQQKSEINMDMKFLSKPTKSSDSLTYSSQQFASTGPLPYNVAHQSANGMMAMGQRHHPMPSKSTSASSLSFKASEPVSSTPPPTSTQGPSMPLPPRPLSSSILEHSTSNSHGNSMSRSVSMSMATIGENEIAQTNNTNNPIPAPTPPITPKLMNADMPEFDSMRLSFNVHNGIVLKPFKLNHGQQLTNIFFDLNVNSYQALLNRADFEIAFKAFKPSHKLDPSAGNIGMQEMDGILLDEALNQPCDWPSNVVIFLNQNLVKQPPVMNGGPNPNLASSATNVPLLFKKYCKQGQNCIQIQVKTTECICSYFFFLHFIHRPTIKSVISTIINKHSFKIDRSIMNIKHHFRMFEQYQQQHGKPAQNLHLSLNDPINKVKLIRIPARGKDCMHLQCFDLETYLLNNFNYENVIRHNDRWKCPICYRQLSCELVEIDEYMFKIIDEIIFKTNGLYVQPKNPGNIHLDEIVFDAEANYFFKKPQITQPMPNNPYIAPPHAHSSQPSLKSPSPIVISSVSPAPAISPSLSNPNANYHFANGSYQPQSLQPKHQGPNYGTTPPQLQHHHQPQHQPQQQPQVPHGPSGSVQPSQDPQETYNFYTTGNEPSANPNLNMNFGNTNNSYTNINGNNNMSHVNNQQQQEQLQFASPISNPGTPLSAPPSLNSNNGSQVYGYGNSDSLVSGMPQMPHQYQMFKGNTHPTNQSHQPLTPQSQVQSIYSNQSVSQPCTPSPPTPKHSANSIFDGSSDTKTTKSPSESKEKSVDDVTEQREGESQKLNSVAKNDKVEDKEETIVSKKQEQETTSPDENNETKDPSSNSDGQGNSDDANVDSANTNEIDGDEKTRETESLLDLNPNIIQEYIQSLESVALDADNLLNSNSPGDIVSVATTTSSLVRTNESESTSAGSVSSTNANEFGGAGNDVNYDNLQFLDLDLTLDIINNDELLAYLAPQDTNKSVRTSVGESKTLNINEIQTNLIESLNEKQEISTTTHRVHVNQQQDGFYQTTSTESNTVTSSITLL